jgi:hypothetical protein
MRRAPEKAQRGGDADFYGMLVDDHDASRTRKGAEGGDADFYGMFVDDHDASRTRKGAPAPLTRRGPLDMSRSMIIA